ncbi:MAG: DnaJ domain-containing protein [Armatimonadetes bacterium]|nr:DnaJ domain-containing protein [Armatimonadota bacterium]
MPTKAQGTEVRHAYRKLARTYHPDLNPDPKAHEQMAKINAAFEVLSDPVRRMEYDLSIGEQVYGEPINDEREAAERPDAVRATLVHRLRAPRTPFYALAYTSDTRRLVSCSFDNDLYWWEPGLEKSERRLKLEGGVASTMVALNDTEMVVAGCTEQQLTCWRVNGGQTSVWRQAPKDWAVGVSVSPDGGLLAVGSVEKSARVLDAKTGQQRYICQGHSESVTALAWSADSRLLATGSADATVRLWDARTGNERGVVQQVRSAVTSMAVSPDGRWLAVAAVDLSIRVFDVASKKLRKTFFGHQRPIEAMAFHPRSWLLASTSRDGSFGLWNVVHGIGHGRIEASLQPLSCLAFSPSGTEMATGGLDKVLRVWRLGMPK